jgi:hypothetical protein
LFGVLAEGTIVQAQNVTYQVNDKAQGLPFPMWAMLVIVVVGLGVFLLCSYLSWRWMRSGSKEYVSEEPQQE